MNRSGDAVKHVFSKHDGLTLKDLMVVHDDLDLRLGEYKIQLGKGPKVHKGLNSVEQALGTKDFWRVRVGVDNRTAEERVKISGERYVLGVFSSEEERVVAEAITEAVSKLLEGWDGFV